MTTVNVRPIVSLEILGEKVPDRFFPQDNGLVRELSVWLIESEIEPMVHNVAVEPGRFSNTFLPQDADKVLVWLQAHGVTSDQVKPIDYKTTLLQLLASLTLCDHLGDVARGVKDACKRIGIDSSWDSLDNLRPALKDLNVTTLNGTQLGE